MNKVQYTFIRYAIAQKALKFGHFTLKSGRSSPYFFNIGLFNTGEALAVLSDCYAKKIVESDLTFDCLFGLAYKGIPLVSSIAMVLARRYGRNLPYCFNRKEAKTHGEKGCLVGAPPVGRVLLIDDVLSAGTAFSEGIRLVNQQNNASVCGGLVSLNRCEVNSQGEPCAKVLEEAHNIKLMSLITIEDIIAYLKDQGKESEQALNTLLQYQEKENLSNDKNRETVLHKKNNQTVRIDARTARDLWHKASCLYDQKTVEAAISRMAKDIHALTFDSNPVIVCLLTGGIVLTGKLLTQLIFPLQLDYIHPTRYGSALKGQSLHWKVLPKIDPKDRTVVLVEDILDEGITLKHVIDYYQQAGVKTIYSAVLLDKQARRKKEGLAKADITGLTVPDQYIIGYGLDYKTYWRNAPGIFSVSGTVKTDESN